MNFFRKLIITSDTREFIKVKANSYALHRAADNFRNRKLV